MKIVKFYLCILSALLIVSGCMVTKKFYPEKQYYLLEPIRNANASQTQFKKSLQISRFRISPAYKGKGFVYRLDDRQFESDYYNEFLISPEEMFTDVVKEWFTQSGLFSHVSNAPGYIEIDYILESSIVEMYGDYRLKNNPIAVMTIQFSLIRDSRAQYRLITQQRITKKIPISKGSRTHLVNGWNQALSEVLSILEQEFCKIKL